MEPTPLRKRVLLLPNFITAFGLSCGLFAIFRVSLASAHEINATFLTGIAGILLLAALADILDGAVARAMRAESEFGGLFDSLADAISFGVAPSIIALKALSLPGEEREAVFLMGAAMVFSLSGVLRLVRFNVQASRAKRATELLLIHQHSFVGLPIPAGPACAVSLTLFLAQPSIERIFCLQNEERAWIVGAAFLLLGYVMISRWRFPSIKTLRVPVVSFDRIFLAVLVAVFILFGVFFYFAFLFFTLSWAYFLGSFFYSLLQKVTGRAPEEPEGEHDPLIE